MLCYLFAFVVLLLSSNPCCADKDCSSENIAAPSEVSKTASSSSKSCMGCSPFFSCGTCAGFTVINTVTVVLTVLPQDKVAHINTYRQPYIEQVSIAIWQPPQLG